MDVTNLHVFFVLNTFVVLYQGVLNMCHFIEGE